MENTGMENTNTPAIERLLLRPREMAELIGVSRTRAYELLRSGTIPSIKIGSSVRVSASQLRRWIDDRVEKTEL
jgi:excisionase family DNA binding protein